MNINKRDLQDIDQILGRAEHAYNFAALESRWNRHMHENGVVDPQERKEFLRQAHLEELEVETKKEEARNSVQNMIIQMEEELIAEGVTDEQERLMIILTRMQEHEAELLKQNQSTKEEN